MKTHRITLHECHPFPFLDVICSQVQWDFALSEERKTVSFVSPIDDMKQHWELLCQAQGTLNAEAISGAAPGTVMIRDSSFERTDKGSSVRIYLERKRDGFDYLVLRYIP